MTPPKYTMTNESISIAWEGKMHTVQKGTANFNVLRTAILNEDWDAIPKNLTVRKSLVEWVKGKFTVEGDNFLYNGEPLPRDLNARIASMAAEGGSPEPLFKFWEKLQKNPSYRSVQQLWAFLNQQGIPLTPDGTFLAYKSVKSDYTDHHSGKFYNNPGTVQEMPRNQISDDPQVACHEGFHVGALGYAKSFGGGDRRIVVCEVDPEDVVCVPYDSSQQKMRVCKYKVKGNHNGELMSSTVHVEEPEYAPEPVKSSEVIKEALSDTAKSKIVDTLKAVHGVKAAEAVRAVHEKTPNKGFAKFDKLDMGGLMEQSIEDLRKYAGKGLEITGASKIPGGKTALVARILEVRR